MGASPVRVARSESSSLIASFGTRSNGEVEEGGGAAVGGAEGGGRGLEGPA